MVARRLYFLLVLATPLLSSASEIADIAIGAQRAWRQGDGASLLTFAHPKLLARIAELQTKFVTQEIGGKGGRPWMKLPAGVKSLEAFKALPQREQADAFFTSMRDILSHHPKFAFTFSSADESMTGDRAMVTVIERQHGPEGQTREVRYPFVLERAKDRWLYVSGGSERVHVDMQLILLGP